MDSERISRDFWRHSDSTGTHIRRTVGRALRDARAIAAGGGPDLPRAKRPEPRVSRLSSSCSRAIREVPSLPRRATVFGPCPRQQHLLSNVDRSQTRISLAGRAFDPSRVLRDARAFPRVTLSASMSHGDTGAAIGDEVRPPPTACRARIFFFFFFFTPPGWESDLTGIRATRASPPFPPARAPHPFPRTSPHRPSLSRSLPSTIASPRTVPRPAGPRSAGATTRTRPLTRSSASPGAPPAMSVPTGSVLGARRSITRAKRTAPPGTSRRLDRRLRRTTLSCAASVCSTVAR